MLFAPEFLGLERKAEAVSSLTTPIMNMAVMNKGYSMSYDLIFG
jgi:hypothetical protein